MTTAALLMAPHLADLVFDEQARARLASMLHLVPGGAVESVSQLPPEELAGIDLLIAGWGAAALTETDLDRLPSLRAVVHWAGGGGFLPAGAAGRGIRVTNGAGANAIPVAEWTVSMLVLAAKDAFWASRTYCREQRFIDREAELPHAGLHRTVVGVVGASHIGALVMEMLKGYDVEVLLHDPYATPDKAAALGAELVGDLVELAERSRLLTLHAPVTPETTGMVSRQVLAAMPDGATLLNTARGAIVDQDALVEELTSGRLRAVLDVTEPDVLPPGHPLYTLDNVFLTPHLAGSVGVELHRLGEAALVEIKHYCTGRPFRDAVGS